MISTFGILTNQAIAKNESDATKSNHTTKKTTSKTTKTDDKSVKKVSTKPASTPAPTSNKVDWTPLLKSMQNGCDLPDFDNAPPAMVASIVPDNGQKPTKTLGEGYKTLNLKDAMAWGFPIKKIQYGSMGAGFSSATVYFNDNRFISLRDKFYIQTASGKLKASDRTVIQDRNAFAGQYLANGLGYNDGRVGVNFSKKTNSITCSWAHLTS